MAGTDLIVLPLPETGELVPLDRLIGALDNGVDLALNGGPDDQARLLEAFRLLDANVARMKRTLSQAIAAHAEVVGAKTLRAGGVKLVVKGGSETIVDAEMLAASYRRAGMPEDRVNEIVVETVTRKVDLVKAKQAAAANPKYKRALARASTTRETPVSVSVEKG